MTATNSTAPAPTRYYAVHTHTNLDLHGWDDRRALEHKQKDFRGSRFVHVIDRTTTCCIACGMPENIVKSTQNFFCTGPIGNIAGPSTGRIPSVASGSWITGGSPASPATPIDPDALRKYLSGPDDCHTEEGEKQIPPKAPPVKSEKVIAESAKPTTGVDWDAHKQFMRGL